MFSRKEMKSAAKHTLKKHYLLFIVVCILSAFLGSEFVNSADSVKGLFSTMPELIQAMNGEELSESSDEDTTTSTGVLVDGVPSSGLGTVISDLLEGNTEAGKQHAAENQESERRNKDGAFARNGGVLAGALNTISSGAILVTLFEAIRSITGSNGVAIILLILLALGISVGFWYLIQNICAVITRRIFLEGRIYDKIPANRLLFLASVKRWLKVCWTIFVTFVFQVLWWLTLIGGFIKTYSYAMVPYLMAENPDMGALETIRLSKRMMKGHKFELFILDISFAPWMILDYITFGFLSIFFLNPYTVCTKCEFYARLRQEAKNNHLEGAQRMNDVYLFEKADEAVLRDTYSDIISDVESPSQDLQLKGVEGFLARNFGLIIRNTPTVLAYEENEAKKLRIADLEDSMEGRTYPVRLFPIPEKERRVGLANISYIHHYSLWSVIMIFFTFCVGGWLWEVSLYLVTKGVFVNRGVLHGPWLPIYGSGAVLILLLLYRLRKKPILEFISAMVLCGVVEYYTGLFMELTHNGKKWWDYTGYFLNIDGRTCAEGLLVFGVAGILAVYVIAPALDHLFSKINKRAIIGICCGLFLVFFVDQRYSSKHPNSGENITSQHSIPHQEICLQDAIGKINQEKY